VNINKDNFSVFEDEVENIFDFKRITYIMGSLAVNVPAFLEKYASQDPFDLYYFPF